MQLLLTIMFANFKDISVRISNSSEVPLSYRLALEIMSYVGMVLSLVGLVIVIITYLAFK